MKTLVSVVAATMCLAGAPAAAQTTRGEVEQQKQSRYQIGQMERVLEGAVEHGVAMIRDRMQAVLPAEMQFISENARARGFRLEGYGVFFDVFVPSPEGTMLGLVRMLDQNDLGLDSALKALKDHVDAAGDVNLQQALRRLELQVGPTVAVRAATQAPGARNATGSAASVNERPAVATDPILTEPNEAYRAEVKQALMDAMLDHASSLAVGVGEWLTVAARRNDDRPRLAPADSDATTMVIRLSGSDLAAFLARQITREEALKRIEVRVF